MAHNVEPMDIDNLEGDFDNKENTFHHNNVLSRTPCTEKGYEELDVSELNMKLRYSITPASSPMSKSYTAHCLDNRNPECPDNTSSSIENGNLTRSFNSMLFKNDNLSKSSKLQPLQLHTSDQSTDNNRNASVLRPLDTTITDVGNNITVTVTGAHDIDENLSLPSSSSSALHTPEATTPTKEIPKTDGGSPIMRGLKSVLNMFRASQSPIPTAESEDNIVIHDISNPVDVTLSSKTSDVAQIALASTPISARNKREPSSKRGSPLKESIVFNEDLEKELLWKDETTILFSEEKIPIHKLFFQQSKPLPSQTKEHKEIPTVLSANLSLNETVEFMDVSYNDSIIKNRTITEFTDAVQITESDSEFVDCETTFTQHSDDEKNTESGKENKVKFLNNFLESNQNINKTGQELIMSTSDECNKESVSTTNIKKKEIQVTQNAQEMSDQNIDKIKDTKVHTESKDPMSTSYMKGLTQESNSNSCIETIKEPTNKSISVMELQSSENSFIQSSTLANVTQSIETEISIDVSKCLDAAVIVDKENKSLPVSTTVQNTEDNTGKQDTNHLDATVSIESTDKPMSVSTFIMNSTQNIPFNGVFENLNTTAAVEDESIPAITLSVDRYAQLNATNELENKSISPSTFIENTPQIVQTQPKNINEDINDTVTLPSDDAVLLPTNINNITQEIDTQSNNDKSNDSLDVTVSSTDKIEPSSSTFIMNMTHDVEALKTDELLETTVTVDSIEKPASPSLTETKDIDSIAISKINNILNPTEDIKEVCSSSEYLDVTLSTLSEGSKCKTQKNVDLQVESDCIELVIDGTVNTGASELSTELNEDQRVQINLVTDTHSPNDICKPMDALNKLEAALETKLSAIQDNTPDNTENKDCAEKQIVNDQVERIEINNSNEIQSINPDLLNSSGDTAKFLMDKSEENVLDLGNAVKVVTLEKTGCGENLPVNIPLPDEDDIEFETLTTVQLEFTNDVTNSNVLPDVINDLDSLKIQDAYQIDELPINTADNMKAPADLITDTLNNKMEDLNSEFKTLPQNNDADSIEIKKTDQDEKLILPQNGLDLAPSIENNNIEEESISLDLKELESNSKKQLESVDINYNNHDSSSHKGSVLEVSQNISEVAHGPIESSHENVTKENKDTSDNAMPSGVNEHFSNSPQMHSILSFDNMEIVKPSDTITSIKNEKISESLQSKPKSETDMEFTKEIIHEEIIDSENNSPYVFVSVDDNVVKKNDTSLDGDFEKIDNPFAIKSKISPSPPASPPIASKGYNFNFNEIDDPFATKTKIRTSPPLDSPKQMPYAFASEQKKEYPKREPANKHKRKSYPVRPKPVITKKNFSTSFDCSLSTPCSTVNDKSNIDNEEVIEILNVSHTKIEDTELNAIEKCESENNKDNESKAIVNAATQNKETDNENKSPVASTTPSSSDQSFYLSAATSSGDSITTKNVFNLPEIDDMNFNPFVTKSKIRLSPPPSFEMGEPVITKTKLDFQNANITENDYVTCAVDTPQNKSDHDEKDFSNINDTTCSSKDDKDTTVREVHTDDDDTVEGPFLDTEDNERTELDVQDKMNNKVLEGLTLQNDMMEFSDLPAQDNEDNELFIDAAAYEFLLNQNMSNVVMDSGKESLFLKFDPLFAKRLSSEGIAAALSKIQKRQSTPKKLPKTPPIANTKKAIDGPSTSKISPQQHETTEEIVEDINVTTSKPMMVVTPAVNPIVKPRKPTTPTSSNRRSITFTSPAIAVIDRLLSLSANNSLVDQNTTITHFNREQDEAELALTQLRELLAEKEINVYNLRSESKELKDRLVTLESQMKVLETESEERLKRVKELNEKLTEKTQINKSMAAVVEEYERTIASLIAETEQDRKRHDEERTRLIKERDEQTAHLASMEVSFSDLHSKYEKSKQIILNCKANEDTYKKSIKEFEESLTKMQNNYELLKQHATSKLNHANQELEKMNRAHESEVLKLNAMIKRKELHITSLEETLAQKTKANEELTAICDELINKVG